MEVLREQAERLLIEEADREIAEAYKRALRKHLDRIAAKRIIAKFKADDPSLRHYKAYFEWEEAYDRAQAEDSKHRADGKAKRDWFITFNPPHDFSPATLWEVVSAYYKKNHPKTIEAAWLRIEQRSEDPDSPAGWHIHVAVRYDEEITRSVISQRMRSVLNRIWTEEQQTKDKKHFYKHWFVCGEFLPVEHAKYMRGEKHHSKMKKCVVDQVVRPRYGFPENLYVGDAENIFSPVVIEDGILQAGSEAVSGI